MPATTILSLPVEIIKKILARVASVVGGCRPSLLSTVLTCHTLREVGYPLLYEKVSVGSLDSLRKLSRTLRRSFVLSNHVKNLEIYAAVEDMDDTLLEQLEKKASRFDFPTLPSCKVLQIMPTEGDHDQDTYQELHFFHTLIWTTHCPELCTLRIRDLHDSQLDQGRVMPNVSPNRHGLRIPETLTRVEILVQSYSLLPMTTPRLWLYLAPWVKSLQFFVYDGDLVDTSFFIDGIEALGSKLEVLDWDVGRVVNHRREPGVMGKIASQLPNLKSLRYDVYLEPNFGKPFYHLERLKLNYPNFKNNEQELALKELLTALRNSIFPSLKVFYLFPEYHDIDSSPTLAKIRSWCEEKEVKMVMKYRAYV